MSVQSLIAARKVGDPRSLQALAVALVAYLKEPSALPTDPAILEDVVDTRGGEEAGTWQEVRAARDYGDLTEAEYAYLHAAAEALTQEESS